MKIIHSPSGKAIKTLAGYSAFLPNPQPAPIHWDNTLVNHLSRADFILGQLAKEGSRLPNPHLLIRPFIAKEAVLSSKIEGTQATIGEILADSAGAYVNRDADDLQEVKNYIIASDYGLELLEEWPLSLRLIKAIHERLMQGVRGSHATPGEFRRSQNWIGTPGCTLATATYVPPAPENLMDTLGAFETFLHDTTLPPLIHAALCHYQFEAIHPFLDGNGRIGRLLITLLLIKRKVLPSPLLYLSAFFEATRLQYYEHLYNVSAQGTWTEWLCYFLNGVATQAGDVLSRAQRINELLTKWQLHVDGGATQTLRRMILELGINPFLTATKITQTLDITFNTAQKAIRQLEALGILSQTNSAKRGAVYCATEILDILEEPTKVNDF